MHVAGRYAVRTLMVLCFLLWWAFLLQPVIQGQIIDAFIKLRKARDDANTEMEVPAPAACIAACLLSSFGRVESARV
eukprot:324458-Rhodomonas_salina.1